MRMGSGGGVSLTPALPLRASRARPPDLAAVLVIRRARPQPAQSSALLADQRARPAALAAVPVVRRAQPQPASAPPLAVLRSNRPARRHTAASGGWGHRPRPSAAPSQSPPGSP